VRNIIRERFGSAGLYDEQYYQRADVYTVTTEDLCDTEWPAPPTNCYFCEIPMSDTPWTLTEINHNKNLCGRDGRTICGPLRVPKSTYVTLAHKRKQKFFYFGCSLVRRFYCKVNKNNNGTDGQTDRQSATQYAAPPREEGRIIKLQLCITVLLNLLCFC